MPWHDAILARRTATLNTLNEIPMTTIHPNLDAPFLVETRHEPGGDGGMVPRSQLILRPGLRDSGLLGAITPEDLKTLMFLLTYLTANGHFLASVNQVASAMGCGVGRARDRLDRLTAVSWEGHPIAARIKRENGLDTYTPTPNIIATTMVAPPPAQPGPPITAAGREVVISESRRRYARTRTEVESDIAIRNGWELPQGSGLPEGELGPKYLAARLLKIGVADNEARILLAAYPPERIFRQTQWLRYRSVKAPAKFIIAAIENDYDEPYSLRKTGESDAAAASGEESK